MENPARKTHPLILLAAASVTLFSLAGTATLLGWRPFAPAAEQAAPLAQAVKPAGQPPATLAIPPGSTITVAPAEAPRPAARVAPLPPRAGTPAVAASPVAAERERPAETPLQKVSSHGIDVIPAAPACHQCGTVDEVREVKQEAAGSGLGAIAGGLLGGVLGNQVGGGNGKKLATVAGAIGGAYAGHQIEKNTRATTQYEIRVSFDDGSHRTFTQDSPPAWRPGDRVRVEDGVLRSR